jgi:hypothetical protein
MARHQNGNQGPASKAMGAQVDERVKAMIPVRLTHGINIFTVLLS